LGDAMGLVTRAGNTREKGSGIRSFESVGEGNLARNHRRKIAASGKNFHETSDRDNRAKHACCALRKLRAAITASLPLEGAPGKIIRMRVVVIYRVIAGDFALLIERF